MGVEDVLAAADEDQVRMMEERVILTDFYDNPIGDGSKKDTHIWTNIESGMLHRAFSVFLFTPDGKLILQQRASTKITFPLIWANTCCSHPLNVKGETEMDDAAGVKNSARRKLEQELGIPQEDVPSDAFTWITRVHYVGASMDGVPPGGQPLWGEHEIDWILMCAPETLPRMAANPNEVHATRAFTQGELRAWMATRGERGEEVSPWFACMEASGLVYKWWDAVLERRLDTVLQRDVIHRQQDLQAVAGGRPLGSVPMPLAFSNCRAETHKGGVTGPLTPITCEPPHPNWCAAAGQSRRKAGVSSGASTGASTASAVHTASAAASVPGASASVPKQGAYGKVKIHKDPLLTQLLHFREVTTGIAFKLGMLKHLSVGPLPSTVGPDALWCEDMLCKTSRSFALVIQQLPIALRVSIGVFYLVLRGLDTVEDDMEAFVGRQGEKLAHLRAFHTYLSDPRWCMSGVGEGDEAALLREFFYVCRTWQGLAKLDGVIIGDICARMGEGMAKFAGKDLRGGTANRTEYNEYCHYVAGLVGEGLTRLFVSGGYEDAGIGSPTGIRLADDMGLFLQKTNIIRDYLEDLVDGRAFYPADIWSKYAPSLAALRDLASGEGKERETALACLNHMVADALSLGPSCLKYMAQLHNKDVFRFCAIPQLMAIATLDKVANNIDVFTGVVKLRRGTALLLMTEAQDMGMQGVYLAFLRHSRSILASIPRHHVEAYETAEKATRTLERMCLEALPNGAVSLASSPLASHHATFAVAALAAVLLHHLYTRSAAWGSQVSGEARYLPRITDSADVLCLTGLVGCLVYLLSFAAVPVVLGLAPTGSTPPTSPAHGRGGAGKRGAGEEDVPAPGPLPPAGRAASPAKSPRKRAGKA